MSWRIKGRAFHVRVREGECTLAHARTTYRSAGPGSGIVFLMLQNALIGITISQLLRHWGAPVQHSSLFLGLKPAAS